MNDNEWLNTDVMKAIIRGDKFIHIETDTYSFFYPKGNPMTDQILFNVAKDPTYCPYCLRCPRLVRMKLVEPYYWNCSCGAECDLRNDIGCGQHDGDKLDAPCTCMSPVEKMIVELLDHLATKMEQCGRNPRDEEAYKKLVTALTYLRS